MIKKIGLLIPQSKAHPKIGMDFIKGCKFGIGEEESIEYFMEGIGFGNDPQKVNDAIDKLVLEKECELLIGLLGDHKLEFIYEKVNALEIPLFSVRYGAYPHLVEEGNEWVFSSSLDICHDLTLLGRRSVQMGWDELGVSVSFNDAGYGFIQALENALYGNGGQFSGHFTPPINPREDEADHLREFYKTKDHGAVCQIYNGVFAKENVEYLLSGEPHTNRPLIFTSFGVTEKELVDLSSKYPDVYLMGSWLDESFRNEVSEIEKSFKEKSGKSLSVHSMLGLEVGTTLSNLLAMNEPITKELVQRIELLGPRRGKWGGNGVFEAEHMLWKCENENGKINLKQVHESGDEAEMETIATSSETGWHNAYLCY